MANTYPRALTPHQKLSALAHRFYQGAQWQPKAGDYYTTSRADLELYRVAKIEEGKLFTEYCTQPGELTEWDSDTFTTEGFGPRRVHVPDFIIEMQSTEQSDSVRVPTDTLRRIHRDLDSCQKVIWLAGCRPRGYGFDPAYVTDAQARLKEIDALLAGGEV